MLSALDRGYVNAAPTGVITGQRPSDKGDGSWTCAAQHLDLRPDGSPERCDGACEDYYRTAGRDHEAGTTAQHVFLQMAQAPGRAGGPGHCAACHVHDPVGQHGDLQAHLVAGECIDRFRCRFLLLTTDVGFRAVGRRQGRVEDIHQLAHMPLGLSALAVVVQQGFTVHLETRD